MKKLLLFIALPIFIAASMPWGQNGHRIVAEVCYRNLTPKAKEGIKDILGKELLAEAATWPDFIRSEKEWNFAKDWHFVTIDPDKTVGQVVTKGNKTDQVQNVIEAIDLMKDILKNDLNATRKLEKMMQDSMAKPLNGSIKATALAFLVHFIGDIHQPMHVGKNKDLGGNKIIVQFFDKKSNLHAVWDSEIIEQEGLSYTEFSTFINKLSTAEIAELQQSTPVDWANESIKTREYIYNTLYDKTDYTTGLPSFSYQYQHDNIQIVEDRLVRAGIRAAGVLNDIFQ